MAPRHAPVITLALLAALGCAAPPARACTTLAVGGGATSDGSIYIRQARESGWRAGVVATSLALPCTLVDPPPAGAAVCACSSAPPAAPCPCSRTEDAPYTSFAQHLCLHPPRDTPLEFKTRDDNLTVLLQPPLLGYIAVRWPGGHDEVGRAGRRRAQLWWLAAFRADRGRRSGTHPPHALLLPPPPGARQHQRDRRLAQPHL